MGRTGWEDLCFNAVATAYSVPEATLRRRFDCKNLHAIHKKSLQHQRHSPRNWRGTKKNQVLMLEERMSGIISFKLRSIAHQVTESNCLPHKFNRETKVAGKKRCYSFTKRRPELSLRWPQSTSLARARSTLKSTSVSAILEELVGQNKLDTTIVLGMDETKLSTVKKKVPE
jgi:hypothetical protein